MTLASATLATTYNRFAGTSRPANLQSEPTQKIPLTREVFTGSDEQNPPDTITLSEDGLRRSRSSGNQDTIDSGTQKTEQGAQKKSNSPETLSAEEQQVVQKLKIRDTEVKAHEQAHLSSAGQYAAGGPSYTYQTGPDGRRYAVGGEVPIDVSKEKTPEQTVQKMRIVRGAALAPAQPSSADQSIAAAASMKEAQALREMNSEQQDVDPTQSQERQDNQRGLQNNSQPTVPEDRANIGRQQAVQALSLYA